MIPFISAAHNPVLMLVYNLLNLLLYMLKLHNTLFLILLDTMNFGVEKHTHKSLGVKNFRDVPNTTTEKA